MDTLVSFLNRDDLLRYISKSMSTILSSQQDSSLQTKEIKELNQFFDVLPSSIHLDSIVVARQLFDYLIQNPPSIDHYRLLSSCLKLMNNDDRLERIQTILMIILDHEQSISLRDFLCKFLQTIDRSDSLKINFDWILFETNLQHQHDSKYLIYVWRFFTEHHQTRLEEILMRILSNGISNDELCLLLIIELRSTNVFLSMTTFWLLIQRALADQTSNNDRIRKCALFLLKQILTNVESKKIQIKDPKSEQFLILINDQLEQFWIDFFVIYEALEDGVVHLIRPLLTKFDRLLNQSFEQGLSLTWIFILLQRLFLNTSAPLGRWTVRWFLNSMRFPDSHVETFFLNTVTDWLSNNFVFLKGDEITDVNQPVEQCLESFFERWFQSTEERSHCLLSLLTRLQTVKWSHLSLVRVLHSLKTFAATTATHQYQSLIRDEHVKQYSSLIVTQFHTFAPVLRLSAYSSILDTVIYLLDWSIAATSPILLRFFTFFDRSTFLSKHFPTISTHFPSDIRRLQELIEEFLNADLSNSSSDTRLFSTDTNVLQSRQIVFLLDLLETKNTDQLKSLFNPLLENIRTAHQRPYMSIDHVRRSIELFTVLIQETYFHSSNFIKDWLSSSLRSIVREGLNFIKLHCIKQPMHFAKLPIVFLMVGNHGDISRFLQELLSQIEMNYQQQTNDHWKCSFIVFAHSIHWLLKHRWSDFYVEWETKFRLLPFLTKVLSQLDKNNANSTITHVDILISKYLLIEHHLPSSDLSEYFIDDCFKASAKELLHLFPALGLLLNRSEISSEDKSKLIEQSLHIISEFDHRIPFYWPCLSQFCQAISSSVMDMNACNVLTPWFEKILDKSGHVSGMINTVQESILPVWLREQRIQSCHLPIIVECILFRQTYQKDKRQQWQAEQLVEQDESYRSLIIHSQTIPEYRYDRNVRITMQLFLLHIWPRLVHVQQHELVKDLIEKHRRLAFQDRRPRFCTNSLEHRLMFRSLQCLLCLTSVIKDSSLLKTIYDYIIETLSHENEPSLRLLAEWILVRLIAEDRSTRVNDLYDNLRDAHRHRTGTICAWISIASHVIHLFNDRTEQIECINRVIEYISPLLINSNFHIRTFACSTMIKIIQTIERNHLEKETPYQAYRWFKQNDEKTELGRYTSKLQSLFLYQFDPMRDFSLETIFYTLPKLSLVAEDEYLLPEWLIEISQHFHMTLPMSVHNLCTILQGCQPGIWRLTAAGKTDLSSNAEEQEGSSTIQHKANPYPTVEPLDDTEIRMSIQRTQLVVVASLIDKQTNLGGLCRTGEIFGVKEMIVGSIRILDDPQFLNLSMTAHKWLRIKQVQERELKEYLIDMQAQGYTIVAVEQTINSKNLYQYSFPEKTLLLLGNEREGIRADLLSLVDATVEIPQAGVIRSLNVHVSGALCISEYARKYLNLVK